MRIVDTDAEQMHELLQRTLAVAEEYLTTIGERPAATPLATHPPLSLPEASSGAAAALELFQARYAATMPASNGPRFWGFVTGGTTPAALMGDWLASTYDINLTSAAYSQAPQIEWDALNMLRALFGLPDTFSGTFVSGATMSNLVGLATGRQWVAQQHNIDLAEQGLAALPEITVLSGAAHSSIFKALAILGMGRRSLRKVALLNGNREAVDPHALEEVLQSLDGRPCIVVANAGTVNTVDFDDLQAIADLRKRYPFWLHVDAAFGGFAVCSPRYAALLSGIAAADSITVDAHKWLNVPYDSALIFTRHRDLQVAVFQNSAAYLGALGEPLDFVHLGPENSRRLRALPAWFSLQAYGQAGYREIVERCCEMAQLLGAHIAAAPAFRLLAPVRLNVVCFSLNPEPLMEDVQAYLRRLNEDGRVLLTPTVYAGVPAIRAAFSNWRTGETDVALAWEAMQSLAGSD